MERPARLSALFQAPPCTNLLPAVLPVSAESARVEVEVAEGQVETILTSPRLVVTVMEAREAAAVQVPAVVRQGPAEVVGEDHSESS